MWLSFFKLIIVFPMIIILLLYVLQFMKKYVQPHTLQQSMQVLQQIKLSTKTNLSVVKVGNQYLVIAYNDQCIELLTTLSEEEVQEMRSNQGSTISTDIINKEMIDDALKKMKRWWKNEHKKD
ncbi:flagellar biosynthetic protein FliO [Turicibacter sanguinis]|uniref:flagellar biosynthetic protein FliO n=1 Tax=Turicibacter sanguinis TaxID=154288 RepID=UPI0018ABD6E2|nr:flagellar biosynthetic protein FliO [Turicibacter sanguinis]MDB8551135.1 flagellar biosynthetic protein FliO [Turicibacter sanguinis]